MAQLIAFVLFLSSTVIVFFILYKKIPILIQLPQKGNLGIKKHKIIIKIEDKIKDTHFQVFLKKIWLHKLLSLIKVLALKIETKTDFLLHKIRKRTQELNKRNKKNK